MQYYVVNTLGGPDPGLAFVRSPPEGLGLMAVRPATGEAVGAAYPDPADIYLEPRSGIELPSLIGNTLGYLIVSSRMKDVMSRLRALGRAELLPVRIHHEKKRLHTSDYWIVNPLGSIDCVNRSASKIQRGEAGPPDVTADRLVLNPHKAEGNDLFRVPEDPRRYVVSERLANALARHGFTNVLLDAIEALAA